MKKKQLVMGLVVLALLAALAVWGRDRMHFDFAAFRSQLALADWSKIGLGLGCIYLAYVFRSVRWALLIRHDKKVGLFSLLGTQVIGFTAVALIGRVADPVRPFLVAKRTGLSVSSQIAAYVVERLFDAGSMGLIFSLAILGVSSEALSHSGLLSGGHSGLLSGFLFHFPALSSFLARFGTLVLTFLGAMFLLVVRLAGDKVATIAEQLFGLVSKKLGHSIAHKIHTFRDGLGMMRSLTDFAAISSLSIVMWTFIALAYFETVQAFRDLATTSLSKCVVLMVASGGASIFQLPVLGWFTQIGIVAAAISKFLDVSSEAATACATMLLLVTFLGIAPVGLIWARFEHVNLRRVTEESEQVSEEISANEPAV